MCDILLGGIMHKIKNAKTAIFIVNANPFLSSVKSRMDITSQVAPTIFSKPAKILLDGIPYSKGFSIYAQHRTTHNFHEDDGILLHHMKGLERMDYYVMLRFLSSLNMFISSVFGVAMKEKELFSSFMAHMKNKPIHVANEWFIGKTIQTFDECVSKRMLLDQFFWCVTRIKDWINGKKNNNPLYPLLSLFRTSIDEHVMLENLYISSPSIAPDNKLVKHLNRIESKMREYNTMLKETLQACFHYIRPFGEVSETIEAANVLANMFLSISSFSQHLTNAIINSYLKCLNEENRLKYLLKRIEEEHALFKMNDGGRWHAFTIILSYPYPPAFLDKVSSIISIDRIIDISLDNRNMKNEKEDIILPTSNTIH